MIHHRERLPLGFEPRDDFAGVHPRLDHLQSDPSPHGILLLRQKDDPTATLADLHQQFIAANQVAGLLRGQDAELGKHRRIQGSDSVMRGEQGDDPFPQYAVIAARGIEKFSAKCFRLRESVGEQDLFARRHPAHGVELAGGNDGPRRKA